MKHAHWKILAAALFVTAAVVPALAQEPGKGVTGRSDEARQNDAAFDAQYRARRNSADNSTPKADPWGGVRTPAAATPPAPATTTKKTKN